MDQERTLNFSDQPVRRSQVQPLPTVIPSGEDVSDLDDRLTLLEGSVGAPDWADITGKPSTFPPTLPIAQADVTGLLAALAGKQDAGSYQPLDSDLTDIAALSTTAFGRGFLDLADAAAARAKLALGTAALSASGDFQPSDADLTAIAALTTTSFGRSLLTLADAAALTAQGNAFTSALKGLAPASGGGTSNFLRADGTWAAPSGGADPWTYLKLAADYNNALATFADINDGTTTLTWTPPANTDWIVDGQLMFLTATTTNLPRIGVNIPAAATRGYGSVNIWQPGATVNASVHVNGAWADAAGTVNCQVSAGGVLTANVPYMAEILLQGRSGAAPTAITFQMACETAAAATCYVKRGSFMRYRTI